MGETPSTFHPSFNAGVVIEARVERLTSDAGAVFVREVMERSGIIEWLTERLHDPRQPHLVTYPLADLLRTMLLLFAQGWRARTTPMHCGSIPHCGWQRPERAAPRRWPRG